MFKIIYPQYGELSSQELNLIKQTLNNAPSYNKFIKRKTEADLEQDNFVENCQMSYVDPTLFGKMEKQHKSIHDSDSDDDGPDPRERCQTM